MKVEAARQAARVEERRRGAELEEQNGLRLQVLFSYALPSPFLLLSTFFSLSPPLPFAVDSQLYSANQLSTSYVVRLVLDT